MRHAPALAAALLLAPAPLAAADDVATILPRLRDALVAQRVDTRRANDWLNQLRPGINSDAGTPVVTSLNQCLLDGPVTIDGRQLDGHTAVMEPDDLLGRAVPATSRPRNSDP